MIAAPLLALALVGPPEPLSVSEAVDLALVASPELLNAVDQATSAEVGLRGVRSLFLPQLTPFYERTVTRDGSGNRTRFGAVATQQFTFGPKLTGSVEADTPSDTGSGYTSTYGLTLEQPLLRGLDPAVTREPLRAAERQVEAQSRSLAVRRKQTVVDVFTRYLDVVLMEELVVVASEGVTRGARLQAASEAKLQAGTLSKLDVLRSQQLVASARSLENDARNRRDDAHDALARITGKPLGTRFVVGQPEALPEKEPDEEDAVRVALARREELLEARARVKDAEIAVRLARSAILPVVDAVAGWSAAGLASGIWYALTTPGKPSYTFGLRSSATLNQGLVVSQKAQTEIALATVRRQAEVLEHDVERAVRQSVRRLRTARERLAIEEANLEVARTQLEVANLRFEKGLSDNFHVVDAENLYNSARVAALTSRQTVLLAELDLLLQSALLVPEDFGSRR